MYILSLHENETVCRVCHIYLTIDTHSQTPVFYCILKNILQDAFQCAVHAVRLLFFSPDPLTILLLFLCAPEDKLHKQGLNPLLPFISFAQ